MRSKSNRKGFTMTELIATLVILGIVVAIAIPGVGKLQTKFKMEYYEKLNASIIAAGKTYFKENSESLPSGTIGVSKLTYDKLIDNKYIDLKTKMNAGKKYIVGYNDRESCTGNFVALKIGKNTDYHNCISCKNSEGQNIIEESDEICQIDNYDDLMVVESYSENSLYIYADDYIKDDLKRELGVQKSAKLYKKSEYESAPDKTKVVKIQEYNDPQSVIYPKNITAISLSEETVVSGKNVGKTVKYSDGKERKVHVYKFQAPKLSNSVFGEDSKKIVKTDSFVLNLEPTSHIIGEYSYPSLTTFSPGGKISFKEYQYLDGNSKWQTLSACGNHNCELSGNSIKQIFGSLSSTKFRIVGYDVGYDNEENLYYGKSTAKIEIEEAYSVSYDANGGEGAPIPQTKYKEKTLILYNKIPTKVGYEFVGWATSSNATSAEYLAGSNYMEDKSVILYAVWKTETYTVDFDPNGGSTTQQSKTVTYGSTYGEMAEAIKTGFVFNGWYNAISGGQKIEPGTTFIETSNQMLYARWIQIPNIEIISPNRCTNIDLFEGVYYIETVGGGAGGRGYGEFCNFKKNVGGNAARWAGYIYLPAINKAKLCIGKGSAGVYGTARATDGEPTYIADSSGIKYVESMGGISVKTTTYNYSNSVNNIKNGISQWPCNNVIGRSMTTTSTITGILCQSMTKSPTYGLGGYKVRAGGKYDDATNGTDGYLYLKYVKSLSDWNSSPLACPSTPNCSTSKCGWINWPTS